MKEEFVSCGLTPTEYEVLIHLMSRGARSAGIISKALNIKRSTVYSALQALERRRLVRKTDKSGPAEFVSATPEEIPTLLLNHARHGFDSVLSAIELIKPRMKRFQGGKLFNAGALEINHIDTTRDYAQLLARHIHSRDFYAVWNPQVAISSVAARERAQLFLQNSARNRNKVHDILADGPMTRWYISQILNDQHQVRIIDPGETSLADLVVTDDVVIVSLNSPDAECALEIKNGHYATFMRWYFMSLWDRLPPVQESAPKVKRPRSRKK